MGFEEVVQQILSSRRDLSREELVEMINEKKQEAKRFFTDEAAARLVALELGVDIALKPHRLGVSIGDLISGLGDVTVTGRITEMHHPRTFTRQDQTEGKLARLVIKDRSGTVRAVLWDDKANLVEAGAIKLGRIVKIVHGYVRESLDGRLELHLGSRGQLEVSPLDTAEEAPPVMLSKIGELGCGVHDVDVLARVVRVGDTREFRRSTDEVGYVATLLIRDETAYTRLNLWEEKASISREIRPGDIILVQGAYTRKRAGKLNINIGRRGTLVLNPELTGLAQIPPSQGEIRKIAEIKGEAGPVTVEGFVIGVPTVREVVTSKGERVAVASFDLRDDTGRIGVSVWRRLAEVAGDLNIGTKVRIENAYVARGFAGQPELTSRMFTSIETVATSQRSSE